MRFQRRRGQSVVVVNKNTGGVTYDVTLALNNASSTTGSVTIRTVNATEDATTAVTDSYANSGFTYSVPPYNVVLFEFAPNSETTQADFDGDGDVDGADFLTWQRHASVIGGGTRFTGDANNDANVDATDLAIWRSQFDAGATGQVVPKPNAMMLSAVLLVAAALSPCLLGVV